MEHVNPLWDAEWNSIVVLETEPISCLPFSISTGNTSIFSTLFSSSYSADAATGSTSSLRRSYSSFEKVLNTCVGQIQSFSTQPSVALKKQLNVSENDSNTQLDCYPSYKHLCLAGTMRGTDPSSDSKGGTKTHFVDLLGKKCGASLQQENNCGSEWGQQSLFNDDLNH